MPALAGCVAIRRSATLPAALSPVAAKGGSSAPVSAQLCANAACISATAGPRSATPVSRHGAPRVAQPFRADAHAGEKALRAIHHQQLAVVAADPAERLAQLRRIEDAHLAAGGAQPLPERAARGA